MKKKRFTEEQIIAILREQEAGAKAGGAYQVINAAFPGMQNWPVVLGAKAV